MNNKITRRLTLYFCAVLLLFSVIVGSAFRGMFKRYSVDLNRQELQSRAEHIAAALSTYMEEEPKAGEGQKGHGMMNQNMGYHAYLRFLNQIEAAEVWVVNNSTHSIAKGKEDIYMKPEDLPENAQIMLVEIAQGKTVFSEVFSPLLLEKALTVGTPIFAQNGDILGVVLLHAPIAGQETALDEGGRLLAFSFVLALVLAVPVGAILLIHFTRPLEKMKKNAEALAEGNYDVRNASGQRDEIGQLAQTMDVLAKRLADASLESERLEGMRRNFISNVSHELRTPVTVMRGSLEALCDGVITQPDQIEEYHRQLLAESIHMQRLVNDLLELTRLQSADFKMEKAEVDLSALIKDVVRSMRSIASQKNIGLVMELAETKSKIFGDYGRLRQMLMILMDNAIKFSPKDDKICIRLGEKEALFQVDIEDHGSGISEIDAPRIFERFYKGDLPENDTGTGLGLALAKEIAARHKALIGLESQPGKTVFSVMIPKNQDGLITG